MRFCSLNTCRWNFFQGRRSHLSIGGAATVSIACVLLLIPLPSTLPCLRQPIPWLSHGPLLLRQSLSSCASGGHLLRSPRRPRRAREELLRSGRSFGVEVRVSLFAGSAAGCNLAQGSSWPAGEGMSLRDSMSGLDQAHNPRRLVALDDDSGVSSSAYPCSTVLDGIRGWAPRDRRSFPLHSFESQSPPWGTCFTRASRGEELHLYDLPVVKDLIDLRPSALMYDIISRERITVSQRPRLPCALFTRRAAAALRSLANATLPRPANVCRWAQHCLLAGCGLDFKPRAALIRAVLLS